MMLQNWRIWESRVAKTFRKGRVEGGRLAVIAVVTRKNGTSISTVPVSGHHLSKQESLLMRSVTVGFEHYNEAFSEIYG